MIAWLYNLIVGQCFRHDWEIYMQDRIIDTSDEQALKGHFIISKCKKCDKIKTHKAML